MSHSRRFEALHAAVIQAVVTASLFCLHSIRTVAVETDKNCCLQVFFSLSWPGQCSWSLQCPVSGFHVLASFLTEGRVLLVFVPVVPALLKAEVSYFRDDSVKNVSSK